MKNAGDQRGRELFYFCVKSSDEKAQINDKASRNAN